MKTHKKRQKKQPRLLNIRDIIHLGDVDTFCLERLKDQNTRRKETLDIMVNTILGANKIFNFKEKKLSDFLPDWFSDYSLPEKLLHNQHLVLSPDEKRSFSQQVEDNTTG